jgi:NAD(P)-dependent dehydrogenase (short-subunit alcohol dehydrogenase family)
MELSNKVALVTGGGSGIGQAISVTLARNGARVGVADINPKGIEETIEVISKEGGEALNLIGDVSNKDQVGTIVDQLVRNFGQVDILVNNAGIEGSATLIHEIQESIWDRVMAVNLKAAFLTCKAVIPSMMARRYGKIVNVASLAARRISYLGGADYTASKYGLLGLSLHLAYELAKYKINVNVLCPGATLTQMTASKLTKKKEKEVAQQIPFGRWCTPMDQAEAVLFLVSERAAMITGMVMDVNGGNLLGFGNYLENMARREKRSARSIASRKNRSES